MASVRDKYLSFRPKGGIPVTSLDSCAYQGFLVAKPPRNDVFQLIKTISRTQVYGGNQSKGARQTQGGIPNTIRSNSPLENRNMCVRISPEGERGFNDRSGRGWAFLPGRRLLCGDGNCRGEGVGCSRPSGSGRRRGFGRRGGFRGRFRRGIGGRGL